MSIDAAVASKLCRVYGHERVYPDARWFKTDDSGNAEYEELPVTMYRQTGGSGSKCLSGVRGSLRDDYFLLEVFAHDRDDCSAVRDKLLREFAGPVDVENPGRWAMWGSPKAACKVHWAEVDDPDAGAEFPETELHLLFRYVRMVLRVQWTMR